LRTLRVLAVVAAETPLEGLAEAVYFPSLVLVIAFRLWAGALLWREARSLRPVFGSAGATTEKATGAT
jgi:hypothetical protein